MKTKKCKCGRYRYPDAYYRDGAFQETCNTCHKISTGITSYKIGRKKTCGKCGKETRDIAYSYCLACSLEYGKNRKRRIRTCKKNAIYMKDKVNSFVQRIESENRMVTLQDINEIITLYYEVATKPSEFDNVESAGMQIQLMYNVLLKISGKKTHF